MNNPIPPPPFSPTGSSSAQSSNSSPSQPLGFASYAQQQPPYQQPLPYQQPPPPYQNYQHYQPSYYPYQSIYQQQNAPFPPTSINYPQFGNVTSPETQPEPEPEPAKEKKGKRVQVKWSDDEAVMLSERWVHVSEKSKEGYSQPFDTFWSKVLADYNSVAPSSRTLSQLQGKWNKIRKYCKVFIAIHKNYTDAAPSGANEKKHYGRMSCNV